MFRRIRPLAVAALAASFIATHAHAQSEGMPWRTDFQAALTEAQQSQKLVLVHFWTPSCGPCKQLDRRVFSQPNVAMAVTSTYVPVKINATEAPELVQAFGVERVPTDVVATADGQLIKAFVSPNNPMQYVGYLSQLAAAYKTRAGATFAAAAAQAPDPATTPDVTAINPGYSAFAAAERSVQVEPTEPANASAAPQAMANQYAVAPAQPAASKVAEAQPAGPTLPPGSPPLGFEGYCPVTMKADWQWTEGDTRWGAIHRGRTYLFASQEAQQTFLTNPDAYSPVLSGADPVAAVDAGKNVPGAREFAVQYQGRFYLFASEETLEKFWSNPTGYAESAARVAAMPAADGMTR